MRVTRTDILLYLMDEMRKDPVKEPLTMDIVSLSVGLNQTSVKVYISNMANNGLIKVLRRQYRKRPLANCILTDKGKERLDRFKSRMQSLVFTPENHNVPTVIKFEDISRKLRSPLERSFLLYLYKSKEKFDLNQYLGDLMTATNDMNLVNFLRKLDMTDEERTRRSYLLDVFNMTLYGDMAKMVEIKKGELGKEDIDSLLIHAETMYKQGKLDLAEMIYKNLLSIQPNMTFNQWIQTNLGLAHIIRRKDGPKEAIANLDKIGQETQDRFYSSLLNQAKGTCYGMMGDYDKAIELLTQCVRSFRQFRYPLLASVALNNRGVAYFSKGNMLSAERDWKEAVKMADLAKSRYARARALGNLADVELKKGNIRKAELYLERSEKLFLSVNDLEGVAAVEFNRALKSIKEKDLKGLTEHLKRSEEVAYPLPPEYERAFRRRVLLERAREMGFTEAEKFIKR